MISNIQEPQPAPYREKSAWLSIVAMVAAFTPYFAVTAASSQQSMQLPGLHQLVRFALTVGLQVAILILGHVYLRLSSGKDAVARPDERDREIERRAITWAYYVLITGMILAGVVLPFGARGWGIVNAALFAIVAAELVHYAAIAVSYRRQR